MMGNWPNESIRLSVSRDESIEDFLSHREGNSMRGRPPFHVVITDGGGDGAKDKVFTRFGDGTSNPGPWPRTLSNDLSPHPKASCNTSLSSLASVERKFQLGLYIKIMFLHWGNL